MHAIDFDPEDSYATYSNEKNEQERDLAAGRAEYVDVGSVNAQLCFDAIVEGVSDARMLNRTSKLRKKGEAVYDKKYEGKKGSRKELYDDEDDEDEESGDDIGQAEGDSDEEMDDFEDLEGPGESAFPEESEDDDDVDDDDEEDEDEDEEEGEEEEVIAPTKSKKTSSRKAGTTTKEQDEKAMMTQLKTAATADVEKGRDVKKQLVSVGCDLASLISR